MTADVDLLERAVDYALSAVDTVAPDLLSRQTPCPRWNLRMLLSHACESVAALQEGLDGGRVSLFPTGDDETAADPTRLLRLRLIRLREEWAARNDDRIIAVADHKIPLSLMADTAALEITVHGWDIFQASGHDRPIPPDLAAELLAISSQLVPDGDRDPLFGPPVRTAQRGGSGAELLAFLGRRPAAAQPTRTEAP